MSPSISEALVTFLTARQARGRSTKTLLWYQTMLDPFATHCANTWPTTEQIETYLAQQRQQPSSRTGRLRQPSSLAGLYRALRAFFGWCETRQKLPGANPMHLIDPPKVPKQKPRAITLTEFEHLLTSIPSNTNATWIDWRDQLALHVLFLCGLRLAEAVNLQITDFLLGEQLLLIRSGKGGDARYVPLLPAVTNTFLQFLQARPTSATPSVFLSADGVGNLRAVLTPTGLRQMVRRRCLAAGIPYRNPHSFRHGIAIHVLNHGGDISLVKQLLGHSRLQTTEHYARWITAHLIDAYITIMDKQADQ